MKVFITGATGFIGGEAVRRLASTPHQLVCLVRQAAARGPLEDLGAHVVMGDITDAVRVRAGMEGCDAVIHLAGAYEFWKADRSEFRRANVDGTRTVLEGALAAGVGKVIHVSTYGVWGNAAGPITEETPLGRHCASEYARSKRAADAVAWHLYEQRSLPLVVVYPAAVIGPGDRKATGRYLARLAAGALPAQICAHHTISLVHVRDVADGLLRALEKEGNIGAKYLLSGGNLTFGELNRLVAGLAGARLPRWEMPDWLALAGAATLTMGAGVVKRPPMNDLALDQVQFLIQGLAVDGSRAARELGISYTPLLPALAEFLGVSEPPPVPTA